MARRRKARYMRMINVAGFAAILGVQLEAMETIMELPGFPRPELVEDGVKFWSADQPLAWLEEQTWMMRIQIKQLEQLLKQAKMATEELVL